MYASAVVHPKVIGLKKAKHHVQIVAPEGLCTSRAQFVSLIYSFEPINDFWRGLFTHTKPVMPIELIHITLLARLSTLPVI